MSSIEERAIELGAATSAVAMHYHLTGNLYPPVHGAEAFAFAAIEAVNAGCPDALVTCDGFAGRAADVCESWHLDMWLGGEDE
jgi:hypothetical protein